MSSNTSEAATTAIDQESQDNQTSNDERQPQSSQTATANQESQIDAPSNQGHQVQSSQTQQSESGQAPRPDPGIQNIADITGGTDSHADDTARMASEPKPDVSDQDYQELLPKLLNHFHNNREELARAIGLHRSTVDRWLNGKSRPNNSTVLRMRRIAQERRIE